MNSRFTPLSVSVAFALLLSYMSGSAETIDTAGENGTRGIDGVNPGQSGGNGTSGQSLSRSAINLLDAVKSITLRAGAGGGGGSGTSASNSPSGSGGNGALGGDASGTASATLDVPEQDATLTLVGGSGGGGGSAGISFNTLAFGGGGDGRIGGDASGDATLTAGAGTTKQTASLAITSGAGGPGGTGVLLDNAQTGGAAGISARGGKASGNVVMRGSDATVIQTLSTIVRAGGAGVNGVGAGVPQSVNPQVQFPLLAEGSFDLETPANNATSSVNFSMEGAIGSDRLGAVSGGPPPSMARLNPSRIVVSGTNSRINFSGAVKGGSALAWSPPSGPGLILPGGLGSGGRGAQPIVGGVELTGGANSSISGSLSLAGGNGATVAGTLIRAGRGADVVTQPGIMRATAASGPISLQISGFGGAGGSNAGGTGGAGGHSTLVNTLEAQTSSGSIVLTQTSTGGSGGGRAVSSLEHDGTTSGFVSVTTRATGGGGATFSPPELALTSTLGSARANTIVNSIGNQTAADAFATGSDSGADAEANAIATGPSSVTSTAVATGGQGAFDGSSRAFSRAEVTTPGSVATAVTRNGKLSGESEALSVAHRGNLALPVSRVTASYKGQNLASNFLVSGAAAVGMDVTNSAAVGGVFNNSGTSVTAINASSSGQLSQAVTQPFIANPTVAAFFTGFPNAKHLVSGRAVQRPVNLLFTDGRVFTHRFSGTLELAADSSGGQLVFSGLGLTTQGGGFDSMTFVFRKDDTPLLELSFADAAEAGVFFNNQTTTLANLSQADSHTVFTWEIVTKASTETQFFDANFLISSTASSGLLENSGNPRSFATTPGLTDFAITPLVGVVPDPLDPAAFGPLVISGTISGTRAFQTAVLEASIDLGDSDSWRPLGVFQTDAAGQFQFENIRDPFGSGAPRNFFRVHFP